MLWSGKNIWDYVIADIGLSLLKRTSKSYAETGMQFVNFMNKHCLGKIDGTQDIFDSTELYASGIA